MGNTVTSSTPTLPIETDHSSVDRHEYQETGTDAASVVIESDIDTSCPKFHGKYLSQYSESELREYMKGLGIRHSNYDSKQKLIEIFGSFLSGNLLNTVLQESNSPKPASNNINNNMSNPSTLRTPVEEPEISIPETTIISAIGDNAQESVHIDPADATNEDDSVNTVEPNNLEDDYIDESNKSGDEKVILSNDPSETTLEGVDRNLLASILLSAGNMSQEEYQYCLNTVLRTSENVENNNNDVQNGETQLLDSPSGEGNIEIIEEEMLGDDSYMGDDNMGDEINDNVEDISENNIVTDLRRRKSFGDDDENGGDSNKQIQCQPKVKRVGFNAPRIIIESEDMDMEESPRDNSRTKSYRVSTPHPGAASKFGDSSPIFTQPSVSFTERGRVGLSSAIDIKRYVSDRPAIALTLPSQTKQLVISTKPSAKLRLATPGASTSNLVAQRIRESMKEVVDHPPSPPSSQEITYEMLERAMDEYIHKQRQEEQRIRMETEKALRKERSSWKSRFPAQKTLNQSVMPSKALECYASDYGFGVPTVIAADGKTMDNSLNFGFGKTQQKQEKGLKRKLKTDNTMKSKTLAINQNMQMSKKKASKSRAVLDDEFEVDDSISNSIDNLRDSDYDNISDKDSDESDDDFDMEKDVQDLGPIIDGGRSSVKRVRYASETLNSSKSKSSSNNNNAFSLSASQTTDKSANGSSAGFQFSFAGNSFQGFASMKGPSAVYP